MPCCLSTIKRAFTIRKFFLTSNLNVLCCSSSPLLPILFTRSRTIYSVFLCNGFSYAQGPLRTFFKKVISSVYKDSVFFVSLFCSFFNRSTQYSSWGYPVPEYSWRIIFSILQLTIQLWAVLKNLLIDLVGFGSVESSVKISDWFQQAVRIRGKRHRKQTTERGVTMWKTKTNLL